MSSSSLSVTARRLKQCREHQQETLDQVAGVLGVNKSTVMRWERGDTVNISRATLNLLAQHYSVSVAWLKGDDASADSGEASLPTEPAICLPILGAVRAGYGGAVFEEIVGYEPAFKNLFSRKRIIAGSASPATA